MQLAELLKDHPGLDKYVNTAVGSNGDGLEPWPDDVLLLFGMWAAIEEEYLQTGTYLSGTLDDPKTHYLLSRSSQLAAIGSWRYAKGIYKFDQPLYDALAGSPLPDVIPMRVFRRLPDWCPYIELPCKVNGAYGFYAYLDYERRSCAWELRIMLDTDDDSYLTIPIALTEGLSVRDAIAMYGRGQTVLTKAQEDELFLWRPTGLSRTSHCCSTSARTSRR